jgi:hypothetical protein
MHSAVPFAIVNGNTTSPPPTDLTAAVCAAYAAAVHCRATCCHAVQPSELMGDCDVFRRPAEIRIAAVCAAHAVDARTPSGAVSDLRHAESPSAAERAEQSRAERVGSASKGLRV